MMLVANLSFQVLPNSERASPRVVIARHPTICAHFWLLPALTAHAEKGKHVQLCSLRTTIATIRYFSVRYWYKLRMFINLHKDVTDTQRVAIRIRGSANLQGSETSPTILSSKVTAMLLSFRARSSPCMRLSGRARCRRWTWSNEPSSYSPSPKGSTNLARSFVRVALFCRRCLLIPC